MIKKAKNGDGTQSKILTAARELFVEHGFTGISMGKIAAKAGVNHSLLFHHFGNKQNLWMEVKVSIVKASQGAADILPPLDQPFDKFVAELMSRGVNYYRKNPDLIRLMNWQRLETEKDKSIELQMTDEMKNWLAATRYFQKRGDINSDLKPEFCVTILWSLVSSAALDPNAFISSPENFKAYIAFCVDRMVKGLQ